MPFSARRGGLPCSTFLRRGHDPQEARREELKERELARRGAVAGVVQFWMSSMADSWNHLFWGLRANPCGGVLNPSRT